MAEQFVTPNEAAEAIRKIVARWKACTQIANLSKRSSSVRAAEAPEFVAGLVAEIMEAATFISQGDEVDHPALAADVAKYLCDGGA